MKRPYTRREDELLRREYRRRSWRELGALLGRTERGVRERARRLGLQRGVPAGRDTLCWSCAHAVPNTGSVSALSSGARGCSWSIDAAPVAGWTARRGVRTGADGQAQESYRVLRCPRYRRG